MKREKYHSAIEAPYRWRDWAAKDDGISGDDADGATARGRGQAARTAACGSVIGN